MSDNAKRRARVLVIDDEPLICDVIRMMLEDKHDVVTVSSGADAQALLDRDQGFDVILCDLMMAGVSGIDLYVWLGQHHPQIRSRIVFMTGGAYTPQSRDFVEHTPNRFIAKPLMWSTVEEAISAMVPGPS